MALTRLGHGLDIVARAGGAFGPLHVDHANLGGQFGLDFILRKSLTVGGADQFNRATESLRQIAPALAKLARTEHQNFVAGRSEVRDRTLHDAGAGGSQNQNVVLGADEFLHVAQNPGKQGTEVGGAVMQRK